MIFVTFDNGLYTKLNYFPCKVKRLDQIDKSLIFKGVARVPTFRRIYD